jgi:hypothetical protein
MGALEHALGDVDADNTARRRGARRLSRRQPRPAPDVENLVTGTDPVGGTKVLVVSAQLGVIEVQAARREHGLDAMDSDSTPRPMTSQRPAATASRSAARLARESGAAPRIAQLVDQLDIVPSTARAVYPAA